MHVMTSRLVAPQAEAVDVTLTIGDARIEDAAPAAAAPVAVAPAASKKFDVQAELPASPLPPSPPPSPPAAGALPADAKTAAWQRLLAVLPLPSKGQRQMRPTAIGFQRRARRVL